MDEIDIVAEKKYPIVEILWTGGYDSSFRMLQLSMKKVEIQPYYLSDNRKSEKYELKAIELISKKILERKETKAILRPLKIVSMSERIENSEITETYKKIRKTDFLGTQYDWLARFATIHRGIEISIHKDDKAIHLMEKYGKLKLIDDASIGKYYVLDKEKSSKEINTLFENYHFPLAQYTKLEMKEEYIKNNCLEIINLTWFCFHPRRGKPCGCCNPCIYTIEEGMKERFSKTALLRYNMKKIFLSTKLWNLYDKIKNKCK